MSTWKVLTDKFPVRPPEICSSWLCCKWQWCITLHGIQVSQERHINFVQTYWKCFRTHTIFCISRKVDVFQTKDAPFIFLAHYNNAEQFYILPNKTLLKMGDDLGMPKMPVTIVSMSARCGSTLLVQVRMKAPRHKNKEWSLFSPLRCLEISQMWGSCQNPGPCLTSTFCANKEGYLNPNLSSCSRQSWGWHLSQILLERWSIWLSSWVHLQQLKSQW